MLVSGQPATPVLVLVLHRGNKWMVSSNINLRSGVLLHTVFRSLPRMQHAGVPDLEHATIHHLICATMRYVRLAPLKTLRTRAARAREHRGAAGTSGGPAMDPNRRESGVKKLKSAAPPLASRCLRWAGEENNHNHSHSHSYTCLCLSHKHSRTHTIHSEFHYIIHCDFHNIITDHCCVNI
jgi:hypothetical protein